MNIYKKLKNLKKINLNKIKNSLKSLRISRFINTLLTLPIILHTPSLSYGLNYNQNDGKQLLKEVGKTISTDSFLVNFPKLTITQKHFDSVFNEQIKLNNVNQIAALIDLADKKQLTFVQNEETVDLYQQYLNQKRQTVKENVDLENIIDITQSNKNKTIKSLTLNNNQTTVHQQNLIKLAKKPVITSTTFTSLALEKDRLKRKIYTDFFSDQYFENKQLINALTLANENKYIDLDKNYNFDIAQMFLIINKENHKDEDLTQVQNHVKTQNQSEFLLDDKERFIDRHVLLLLKHNKEHRKSMLKQSLQKAIDEKVIENSCVNPDILKNFVRSEQGFYQYKNLFPEVKFGHFSITSNKKDVNKTIITPSFNKIYQNVLHYENQKSINREELYKNIFAIKINNSDLLNKMIMLSSLLNETQIKDKVKTGKNNQQKTTNQTLLEQHLDELAILASGLNKNEFQDFLKASLTLIHYNSMICIY